MKLHIFIFSLFAVIFSTCKPKDPCNKDLPKPVITLYEYLGENELSKTDTVLQEAQVVFEAPEGFESYTWKIGYDTRTFTQRKFSLYLRAEDLGNFPVRLITKRKPNTDCNPLDTGIDTTRKTLSVVFHENAKIIGKFKGKRQELNESEYVVDIVKEQRYNGIYYSPIHLSPDCPNKAETALHGYKAFSISGNQWRPSDGCNMYKGYAEVDDSGNTLVIKYTHIEPVNPYPHLPRTFVGKRIP